MHNYEKFWLGLSLDIQRTHPWPCIPGMLAWNSNIPIIFIVNNKIALVFEAEVLKVTRPSFFGGVPSYFEALWYPHLYFYRKSNT